jgi:hypothetical protein
MTVSLFALVISSSLNSVSYRDPCSQTDFYNRRMRAPGGVWFWRVTARAGPGLRLKRMMAFAIEENLSRCYRPREG